MTATTVEARIRWNTHKPTGYPQCNLNVGGDKVARCNGGGYDMVGTCFGDWVAATFVPQLNKLTTKFYGLTFHDPNFDAAKVVVKETGRTVEEMEKAGTSLGLDRYQQTMWASSPVPTATHTEPQIDGGCGLDAVRTIFEAIGGKIKWVKDRRPNGSDYEVTLPQ